MGEYTGGSSASLYNTNEARTDYTAANINSLLNEGPTEKSILPKIIPLKKRSKKVDDEEKRIEQAKKAASKSAKKQQKHMNIPKEQKPFTKAPRGDIFNAEELAIENESARGSNIVYNTRLAAGVRSYLSRVEKYMKPDAKLKGRVNLRIGRL